MQAPSVRVPNISLEKSSPGERQSRFYAERYVFCDRREWVESSGYFLDLLPLFGVKPGKLVKELCFCFLFLCKGRAILIFSTFCVFVLATGSLCPEKRAAMNIVTAVKQQKISSLETKIQEERSSALMETLEDQIVKEFFTATHLV